MNTTLQYCSYDKYSVLYDVSKNEFDVLYQSTPIITQASVTGIYRNGEKIKDIKDMQFFSTQRSRHTSTSRYYGDDTFMSIVYHEEGKEDASLQLGFIIGNNNVLITAQTPECDDVQIKGFFVSDKGNADDTFAVCLSRTATDLRSAIGAAISDVDHALYNKKTDSAIVTGESGQTRIHYDKENKQYSFEMMLSPNKGRQEAEIRKQENILAEKYNIHFSPINKNSTFSLPPIGWMTWYAVKFDASEEIILKNAKWQAEHLKDYGANTVWVDWEWYHPAFNSEGCEGIHSLQENVKKYPHGMKYLADQIKEMGLIPALWIGYTNEPSINEYIEKYPDIVLTEENTWCGEYYYDFSNPHYLNEYLPAALENVHKWGYEAVKYDTLPISIGMHEKYHMNMYDSSLTTREAFLNMIKKTREVLGENMYMLSCSGSTNASILWASDIFDAARIGEDIFTWEENMNNIERLLTFYPLHNIQFYNDPDNVVLREEFNNFEQAKSRVSMTSLLGLPMTFGDEFSALDEERINLIKRSMPVLDIHPMDLCNSTFDRKEFLINLNIAKEYENYQVSGIFNMKEDAVSRTLSLSEDFHLEKGNYLVYDFYHDAFLGEINTELTLDFLPYECRILALRPYLGIPQIVSTSRHITQGAAEIVDMKFKDSRLCLTADLVANDNYTISIYIPKGYRLKGYSGFERHTLDNKLLRLSFLPQQTQQYEFTVSFEIDS